MVDDDLLIQKFGHFMEDKVGGEAFNDDELARLYDLVLTAAANKIAQANPATFQLHETAQ
jgi:hypothetical protein